VWVPAATVVTHGPPCATVEAVGPLLPAEVAHEHAGVGREQEGDLHRVAEAGCWSR
jgi:hypothetical protein